jgi:hypothetical protein
MLTSFLNLLKDLTSRYLIITVAGFGVLSCNNTDDPAAQTLNQVNSIEVVSIDPAGNSKLDNTSIISADLKYTIDLKEKSDDGFKIMIMFTKPGDTTWYSVQPNSIVITSYSGTVKLSHDLLKEWNQADTRHPIQCHFNLLKRTSSTTNSVLAKTPNIDYLE